jgi:hypothetical protein
MAGKHSAKKRHSEAHVWLGAGAMTLGLGVALAAGSGVAHADTTNASVAGSPVTPSTGGSAATTSIRTTVSAQSVVTSTNSDTPENAGPEQATSVVTNNKTVVRQMNPADTGDNDPRGDSTVASQLLGLANNDPGLGTGAGLPNIPFIELGGGGGGLLSKIAGALGAF